MQSWPVLTTGETVVASCNVLKIPIYPYFAVCDTLDWQSEDEQEAIALGFANSTE